VLQVDSDWKADPVLEDACEEVVTAACDPKVHSSCPVTVIVADPDPVSGAFFIPDLGSRIPNPFFIAKLNIFG
jgi:hypothetical protein